MFKRKGGGGGGSKAFWTMFKKTALFLHDGFPKAATENIARIANALQVTLKLSVTNPQCHDYSWSICQEISNVSLGH